MLGIVNGMDYRGKTTLNGLHDIDGKVVIPCKYDRIYWATENILVVDSAYPTDGGKFISTKSALFSN